MNREDLEKQIELLVRDDESNQQTIINQRQEIERLKEIIEDYRNKEIIDFSHKLDESWYKEDYEKLNHRINKAIEYIEKAQQRDEDKESCSIYIPKLLEILKGE